MSTLHASSGFNEAQSLYDLLEVRPDASPQEIRAAYLRAKASFQRDSLALYSLMGEEEASQMLKQVEEAFQILSNPDRKRLYDQSHLRNPPPGPAHQAHSGAQIISIDRAPPMAASQDDSEDLLIPPSTDFSGAVASEKQAVPPPATASVLPAPSTPAHSLQKSAPSPVAPISTGQELREVRERKGISIDYLVEITRIRKTYLQAIEAENFEALPAAVYIRGFIAQMARELHIPSEPLVSEFLKRYSEWKQSRDLSRSLPKSPKSG